MMTENIQIVEPLEISGLSTSYIYDNHEAPTAPLPDFSDREALLAVLPPSLAATLNANQGRPAFAMYEDSPYSFGEDLPLSDRPDHVRRQIGTIAAGAFNALLAKRSAEN